MSIIGIQILFHFIERQTERDGEREGPREKCRQNYILISRQTERTRKNIKRNEKGEYNRASKRHIIEYEDGT